jgi:hypothetical protein
MMELRRCLICRGIELVLKTLELKDDKKFKTHQGNAIDNGALNYENAEEWKRTGKKRRIQEVDKGWANRMASVKLIYLKVKEVE